MSYTRGYGSDWDNFEHFAESRDLDPYDEDLQAVCFTFIFEYGGEASRSDPDSVEALFDFLDAIDYEYDEDDIYERYVSD
jgi:hypothetical protein